MRAASVFLSYASHDTRLAVRLRADLIQSGAEVWAYEVDQATGVDYVDAIAERIRASGHFVLLDTPSARASAEVRRECTVLFEERRRRGLPSLHIALAVPAGAWREVELFTDHNRISWVDLTDYDAGSARLAGELGLTFRPLLGTPRAEDFEEELAGHSVIAAIRNELLSEFAAADAETGQHRLDILTGLVRRCDRLGVAVVTPALAVAIEWGHQSLRSEGPGKVAGLHESALRFFSKAAESHPNDPRGWAGQGATLFFLGRFDEAVAALRRALRAVSAAREAKHRARESDVRYNLAQALRASGRGAEALACLQKAPTAARAEAQLLGLEAKLMLEAGDPKRALDLLQPILAAADPVWPEHLGDAILASLRLGRDPVQLARRVLDQFPNDVELLRIAAAGLRAGGHDALAVTAMEHAFSSEDSVRIRAEAALLFHSMRANAKCDEQARETLARDARTPVDRYYRGLAHYLLGHTSAAQDAYSEASGGVDDPEAWPWYDELLIT